MGLFYRHYLQQRKQINTHYIYIVREERREEIWEGGRVDLLNEITR